MLDGFKELPSSAKKLILYYTFSSPLLISWTVFPIYLFMLGLTVVDIGEIFTFSLAVEVIFTFIIGILIDKKLSAKKVLIFLELMNSFGTEIEVLIGRITDRISSIFTVVFSVYEKTLYSENIREKAFSYHMALPNLAVVLSYPIIGIVLSYFSSSIMMYRLLYLGTAIGSILMAYYVYVTLPDIPNAVSLRKERQKVSFKSFFQHRKLFLIAIGEITVVIGYAAAPTFILANYLYNILGFSVFFFVMTEVVSGIFSLLASFISTKYNKAHRFKMLYLSLLMLVIYSVLIFFSGNLSSSLLSLLIVFIAVGLGEIGNTFHIIFGRSYLFDYIPEEYKGTILGLISSIVRVSGIFLPLIAGILAYSVSPLFPYLISCMFFGVGAISYFLSSRVS
ncbi:MAG: MFS transporter [Candidatus Asgardarchaeia archaeon]